MIDLSTLSIRSAHESMKAKKFSAVDLVQAYLKEIEKKNKELNVYLEVYSDVLEQAKKADELFASGKATLITGIPFAIKDNILIQGKVASSASKMLANYVATYDATAITKLKAQGAVFLGRTNMDEFAMGGSNENSAYGPVGNPYDSTRVSGGSSGGSVAAVAANMALVSLGSDTGGSVRQPASFCGVLGLKPSYGRVSRHGLMAMGSSLDQIGAIGKTADDVEIVYETILGNDPYDGTTLKDGAVFPASSRKGTRLPVIGVPRELLNGVDPDVLKNFEESLERLRGLGFEIKDISLPNSKYALAVYYVIMPAESSSNLARFEGVKYGLHKDGANLVEDYFATRTAGFGREVKRRILIGNYILSSGYYDAYYNKANIVRDLLRSDYEKAFESVDLVLTPTSPTPAFKIGEKSSDPLSMYLADVFTVTANLTSMPALSIPSGFTERDGVKLPLGIQATARFKDEAALFVWAKTFLGK